MCTFKVSFTDAWYLRSQMFSFTFLMKEKMKECSQCANPSWFECSIDIITRVHDQILTITNFNLKSDHLNLVAPAIPIECLLYLLNFRAIKYKLGPERLTRFGDSNVVRLPVQHYRQNYTVEKIIDQRVN